MSDPIFVQGSSGSISLMDVPTDLHARERFDTAIAKGELKVLDPSQVIETTSRHGGVVYLLDPTVAPPVPADDVTDASASAAEPAPADESEVAGSDGLDDMTKADLVGLASSLGIEPASSWSKPRLIAEITAVRDDD